MLLVVALVAGNERKLLVVLGLSTLVRDADDGNDDGGHGDGNAGNGPGRQSGGLHAGGSKVGLQVLRVRETELDGLVLAEMLDHGGLAAELEEVELSVVEFGQDVLIEFVEVDLVIKADTVEELRQELFPIVDDFSVGDVALVVLSVEVGAVPHTDTVLLVLGLLVLDLLVVLGLLVVVVVVVVALAILLFEHAAGVAGFGLGILGHEELIKLTLHEGQLDDDRSRSRQCRDR